MPKEPPNQGKHWKPQDVQKLRQLAKENTPTRVMGLKLGRSEDAVRAKAYEDSDIFKLVPFAKKA